MRAKIRFEFYNQVLEREEVETMWAEVLDDCQGFYKLDNIPFFVTSFATEDIVKAIKVDDGFPKVTGLVKESGNSTINIIFLNNDEQYKSIILKRLTNLGAEYEGMESLASGYYSLNIPKNVDYRAIYEFLSSENENLDFREACIAHHT